MVLSEPDFSAKAKTLLGNDQAPNDTKETTPIVAAETTLKIEPPKKLVSSIKIGKKEESTSKTLVKSQKIGKKEDPDVKQEDQDIPSPPSGIGEAATPVSDNKEPAKVGNIDLQPTKKIDKLTKPPSTSVAAPQTQVTTLPPPNLATNESLAKPEEDKNIIIATPGVKTEDIGEGIVVVTQANTSVQSLAIDTSSSKLVISKPFTPPEGWDSIADVCLFGSAIFFPIVLFLLLRYVHRKVHTETNMFGKMKKCFALAYSFLRTACLNTIRLRHCRGEDLENLGSESALYLALQRETAVMVLLLSVLGCSILLPLHITAGKETVKLEFTRTTVQHLAKHSPLLWVHTAFVLIFSWIYYRYMAKCRQHVQWAWKHGVIGTRSIDMWDSSVFVKSKLPEELRSAEIKELLNVIYPGQISNVIVIMDTTQAVEVEVERKRVENDLQALKRFASRDSIPSSGEEAEIPQPEATAASERPTMPKSLSREWALVAEKEEELERLRKVERRLQERHAGKCIITFNGAELASRFSDPVERGKAIRLAINTKLKFSMMQTKGVEDPTLTAYEAAEKAASVAVLKARLDSAQLATWEVVASPDPHDIIWNRLHLDPKIYWLRTIVANIFIALVLVLFTTPTAILGLISHVGSQESIKETDFQTFSLDIVDKVRVNHPDVASFLFVFLPQFILVTVNNTLTLVIYVIAKYWEPHHTLSSQEISILQKTTWFLLFNTLLVPALAFKTLAGFVGGLVSSQDANPFALLGQVFVITSGAFTLAYIITQTLVGRAFQLLNFSSWCTKMWENVKPWAGDTSNGHDQRSTFDFGNEYATFLSLLALVIMFSTMIPVILPFGVVYFFVKLCVDQYQLNAIRTEGEIASSPRCRIGRAAVRFLPIPLLLYQVGIIGYFSSYVCITEIESIASGKNPRGCTIVSPDDSSTAIPGTQVLRGTVLQLLIVFCLFIYTASDCLYVFMIDSFNEDGGMVVGAGYFLDGPFASDKEKTIERSKSFRTDTPGSSRSLMSETDSYPLSVIRRKIVETLSYYFGLRTSYARKLKRDEENESNGSNRQREEDVEEEVVVGGDTDSIEGDEIERLL